eukprot:CAMPEP_0179338244 /NCGR_PEP_ID=MMETSP0797-20121207/68075_1 /TAXON_ID=47934 /ORGANISM="Dinophysis acuminata, Strain DAEP01" /LENGTH=93 /DNA_ID=CAMNT_0021051989 /DNA_START=87 /DNA_END=368 /DNA_ORIENTATION=+
MAQGSAGSECTETGASGFCMALTNVTAGNMRPESLHQIPPMAGIGANWLLYDPWCLLCWSPPPLLHMSHGIAPTGSGESSRYVFGVAGMEPEL